jgi:hypothetical protein
MLTGWGLLRLHRPSSVYSVRSLSSKNLLLYVETPLQYMFNGEF